MTYTARDRERWVAEDPAHKRADRDDFARDRARLRLILRGRRFGMTLAECREIVDMYDGAASSERQQLTTLLARLDEIAEELRRRAADLQRTLGEVEEVAGQCRQRLGQLAE